MAIKAFSALQPGELVAHAEVVNAVSTGALVWKTSNPNISPAGYCYTRADFEAYIQHSNMSGSGIALNECMSKSEMETYRVLAAAVTAGVVNAQWVDVGVAWRAALVYAVNGACSSVKVEVSISGGGFTPVETLNVTPGSSGNSTSFQNLAGGETISFRLTPYSGANGTGTAGDPETFGPFDTGDIPGG